MAAKMTVEVKKNAKGKGKTLVVSIPMVEQVSKSGKSVVVATTSGNKNTGIKYKGHEIMLGVNAYIPNEEAEE
jgi:hypothetical protein